MITILALLQGSRSIQNQLTYIGMITHNYYCLFRAKFTSTLVVKSIFTPKTRTVHTERLNLSSLLDFSQGSSIEPA